MTSAEAYADLRRLGKPVLTTRDAADRLRLSPSAASRLLTRLARSGLVEQLRRGRWAVSSVVDTLALPEYLTAPYPSYVSLLTALQLHGMISQIPSLIFVASLAPTRRIETSRGVFSIHRLGPEFFGGFEETGDGIKLATPEKALLDVLYLSRGRSRLFSRLPELELPERFDVRSARRWIAGIPATYQRTMVRRKFDAILGRCRSPNELRTGVGA